MKANMNKQYSKEHICCHVWNVLVKLAESHQTVFYTEIRDEIEREFGIRYASRAIGGLLEPIQDHCQEKEIPPLTVLVINKNTGLPGSGFVAESIISKEILEQKKGDVFAYNWKFEENPFQGYDSPDLSVESYALKIVKHPESSKEVWRKVKDRGQCQKIFREGLLNAYNRKCAVCGMSIDVILQAAHIHAWAECSGENKVSINNGILMCPNHHSLYDSNWMTISEDYVIGLGCECEFNETDKEMFSRFIGKKIKLPIDERLWPSRELLKKHK